MGNLKIKKTICRWTSIQLLEGSDKQPYHFQHPVVLTLLMFLGEYLCFAVYKIVHMLIARRPVSSSAVQLWPIMKMYLYMPTIARRRLRSHFNRWQQ